MRWYNEKKFAPEPKKMWEIKKAARRRRKESLVKDGQVANRWAHVEKK